MSLSFGFAEAAGSLALAAGVDSPWSGKRLSPNTLVPLGSVTKTWTALFVMQHVEAGRLSLDDLAAGWVDPVLRRVYGDGSGLPAPLRVDSASLVGLWGPQAAKVTIGDLLGMTSGFADYDDSQIMRWTLTHGGDDTPPWAYLVSASRSGYVCPPRTCAAYSGANYVLLGFVLVQLRGMWSWQDLDQLRVIPEHLWESGRYRHTSFPKFGRCGQYPGFAHQWASYWDPRYKLPRAYFNDLFTSSCLNGWTMGNIASTGGDLARFFYDIFSLAPTGRGYVNATTLEAMLTFKRLSDKWCVGPTGPGSCLYGMGFFRDLLSQDTFRTVDPRADKEAVRLVGHPGQDWGSVAAPCGYNGRYGFGLCLAIPSASGMNCSNPWQANAEAYPEAACRVYDAVLGVVGGPRLLCPAMVSKGIRVQCTWANEAPQLLQEEGFMRSKPVRWMMSDMLAEHLAQVGADVDKVFV